MLGAGKSSTSNYLAARLRQVDRTVVVLDEDELGEIFWTSLDPATPEDWKLVTNRMAWIADTMSRAGLAVVVASTSPFKVQREEIRRRLSRYIEVFIDCPTDVLIKRDTTGLYKKALSSAIPHFPGITSPYEPPTTPEVPLFSDSESTEEGATKVFRALQDLGLLSPEDFKIISGPIGKKKPAKVKPAPAKAAKPSKKSAVVAKAAAKSEASVKPPAPKKEAPSKKKSSKAEVKKKDAKKKQKKDSSKKEAKKEAKAGSKKSKKKK